MRPLEATKGSVAVFAAVVALGAPLAGASEGIIPGPADLEPRTGGYVLERGTAVSGPKELAGVARILREQVERMAGLRLAGAIALGKTVCTEFAHRAPGATTNPWNPLHTPGGSSSGSAAARVRLRSRMTGITIRMGPWILPLMAWSASGQVGRGRIDRRGNRATRDGLIPLGRANIQPCPRSPGAACTVAGRK